MTITTPQRIKNKDQIGTQLQKEVNEAVNLHHDKYLAKAIARVAAIASHAELPQYNNMWDWEKVTLVMVKREVKTKRGIAFLPGDMAIATTEDALNGCWTLFSLRNGGTNTSVPSTTIEVL